MSTAAERLRDQMRHHPDLADDIRRVLNELDDANRPDLEASEADAERYGFSPVTIHNDLRLAEGFRLTRHAEVRFQTGPDYRERLELTMPTTRDQGWVQVTSGDFSYRPTVQLRGGMLMLKAVSE